AETRFNQERVASRLEDGFLDATTLMEFLIRKGVPMRAAHEGVGKLVRHCEEKKCRLADLHADDFEAIAPRGGAEVRSVLGVANALAAFQSYGSTAPVEVQKQLTAWQQRLARERGWNIDSWPKQTSPAHALACSVRPVVYALSRLL